MIEMAPATAVPNAITDKPFRRSVLVLRWGLLAAFVGFTLLGVLDVTPRALIISSSLIAAYTVFHTIVEARYERLWSPAMAFVTRHLDVLPITVAMVAIHDVRNPVWAVYFITIVRVAHIITRREMMPYTAWVALNYVAFAAITAGAGYDVSSGYVVTVVVLLLFMGFNASMLAGGQQRVRDVMAHAASTDSLTGLPNRHCFHANYTLFMQEAVRERTPLALMLLDVDHFKEINDTQGHPAGDDKLREVARALAGVMRRGDMVARYGGDEFIVVAPKSTEPDALRLAERLRAAASGCGASVSTGVAMYPADATTPETLIDAADQALYRAKQAGRNCVRAA